MSVNNNLVQVLQVSLIKVLSEMSNNTWSLWVSCARATTRQGAHSLPESIQNRNLFVQMGMSILTNRKGVSLKNIKQVRTNALQPVSQ